MSFLKINSSSMYVNPCVNTSNEMNGIENKMNQNSDQFYH